MFGSEWIEAIGYAATVATVATYFQQAMMQPPAVEVTAEQKAQQDMMKIFPLVFMVVFYGLPSGFMLYWVVNSALTVVQQLAADKLAKRRGVPLRRAPPPVFPASFPKRPCSRSSEPSASVNSSCHRRRGSDASKNLPN